ncbi:MAG: GTP cyclohydrolase II [Rickettsiales bacterium]
MVTPETNVNNAPLMAARAIDELRRQMGLVYSDESATYAVIPAEFADDALLTTLKKNDLKLIISAARAKTIDIATGSATAIDVSSFSLDDILAVADPTHKESIKTSLSTSDGSRFDALLSLAKHASLLPALLVAKINDASAFSDWMQINHTAITHYLNAPEVEVIKTAQAKLPINGAQDARLISFRLKHAASVHLALMIGEPQQDDAPLVRVHSSCVTGDILGSLRCDCGDQLHLAIQQIIKQGSGVLLYLHQEGRGIGITNKLRAYRLQEKGIDTYDANLMLGYEEDERDFSLAAAMLKQLNIGTIQLLTNNPMKLTKLKDCGINITKRVSLIVPAGEHNHAYIEAKGKKAGHLF